jgi:hypothetical protein
MSLADQSQLWRFEETTDLGNVAPEIRREAFAELVEIGPTAIDAVVNALPEEFLDFVAGPENCRVCVPKFSPDRYFT